MIRVLGVYREPEFSPGKVGADAAILDAALSELRKAGVRTATIDAAGFAQKAGTKLEEFEAILAMCQSRAARARLEQAERRGVLTINSARAIRNCFRDRLTAVLDHAAVPTPRSTLVSCKAPQGIGKKFDLNAGVFLKRRDFHALSSEDVVRVTKFGQLGEALARFAERGLCSVLLQQAVPGVPVKFYGVSGGEFFAALAEQAEPDEAHVPGLARTVRRAASALGLEVWGGDAIVSGEGFSIVDFNDWPSFARVREAAAGAIMRRTMRLLERAARREQPASESTKS